MAAWEAKPLGDLCEFHRGLTYGKSDEVDVSSNVVLRANNVDLATHTLDLSDLRYISNSVSVPPAKKVRKGSLLICTASGSKSHLGKIAYVDDDYGYAFGGFMGQITPAPGVNDRYLFHALTSPAYKGFIEALSDGVNINNLKFDDLRQFIVPIPALAEQRRIVAILDEAFEGIATAKANAERNLQSARELFRSHLERVFLQHGESSPAQPLEELTEPDSPITYGVVKPGDEGEVAFVRGGDIAQGRVLTEQLRTIDATVSRQYRRTLLRGGELLISLVGQPGQVAVAPEKLKGANIARQVGLIRLNEHVDAEFVRYFLQSPVGQAALGARQSGSVQQVINLGELREVMVPIPALAVQRDAVTALDAFSTSVERLTDLVQSKLAALGQLKRAVLHQAFSGALTNETVDKKVAEVA